MRLKSDRGYRFPFGPDELWDRINQVTDFPSWWPWLRTFDGEGLRPGDVWHCAVQPPLPYAVRFTVTIDEVDQVDDQRFVAATVLGDIVGTARLHIEPADVGSRVRLIADLVPHKQSLQILSIAARPLVRFGHNWVLDTGARQFLTRSASRPRR